MAKKATVKKETKKEAKKAAPKVEAQKAVKVKVDPIEAHKKEILKELKSGDTAGVQLRLKALIRKDRKGSNYDAITAHRLALKAHGKTKK